MDTKRQLGSAVRQVVKGAGRTRRRRNLVGLLGVFALAMMLGLSGRNAGTAEAAGWNVSDLKVISGNSSSISCGSGWTKKGTDLNAGAGGKYIYLCVKYGWGTSISKLYAVSGGNTCASGDSSLGVNLNEGTRKGKYIQFCVERKYNGNDFNNPAPALGDVNFMTFSNSTPGWMAVSLAHAGCAGAVGFLPNEQDLNEGAGGQWIYTCNTVIP